MTGLGAVLTKHDEDLDANLIDPGGASILPDTAPGNDVIQVEGDTIRLVEVDYDRQAADDHLGGKVA